MTVVAFDFDGTLADTMPGLADLATELISSFFKLPKDLSKSMYLSTIGRPFETQIEMLFPEEDVDRKKLVINLFNNERVVSIYNDDTKEMPYASMVVRVLKNNNIPMYLCSSTPSHVFGSFVKKYFQDSFSSIKGQSKTEQLQRIKNFHHENIYFVGDAPYDREVAESIGISFIDANESLLNVLATVL